MPFGSFLSSGSSINPSITWSRGKRGEGRFRITFPLDSTWYKEQSCTRFQSLEHRKERSGRFRHEFVVLKLENDWICRIERMGDPDASFNAIGHKGIVAHDVIQSFPPNKRSEACLETSDVVAEITFPRYLDLMNVLLICRAMQEGEKTCNYTLQVFNCYFFALTIQAALTRLVADWGYSLRDEIWNSTLGRGPSALSDFYKEVSSAWEQQPFMSRIHSALRPDTQWPTADLMCNLNQELRQLADVSQLCHALLWYTDAGSAVDHALCRRVRDAAVGILKNQLLHLPDQHAPFHVSPLDLAVIQSKDLLLELLSRAISRHEQEFQTPRLSRTQQHIQVRKDHLIQEFKSFQAEWTLGFLPSNPRLHPDPPRPHPDPPKPNPDLPQLHQDSPQLHGGSSQSDPSLLRLDLPKPRLDSPKPHPDSPKPRPDSPKLHPDPPQSTLFPFPKTSQISVWLAHAKILALWAFQFVLGLFGIDLPVTQPTLCMFIEDELEPSLTILKASGRFTLISRKLRSLAAAPPLLIQWKEWPWDHIYQPIRQHILAEKEGVLQVSFPNSANPAATAMVVSKFQGHLLERIRDHAKRVDSFWLGSAAEIQDEMEDKISQVWASIRPDDTTPIPVEAIAPAPEAEAKTGETAEAATIEPKAKDGSKAENGTEAVEPFGFDPSTPAPTEATVPVPAEVIIPTTVEAFVPVPEAEAETREATEATTVEPKAGDKSKAENGTGAAESFGFDPPTPAPVASSMGGGGDTPSSARVRLRIQLIEVEFRTPPQCPINIKLLSNGRLLYNLKAIKSGQPLRWEDINPIDADQSESVEIRVYELHWNGTKRERLGAVTFKVHELVNSWSSVTGKDIRQRLMPAFSVTTVDIVAQQLEVRPSLCL
ncbi:hypothetical protein FRC10_002309 [Ceratobasidium sp. 414]|nr:hypothetical protein FRC10_002309 [Ceratobasidium sp. 414]